MAHAIASWGDYFYRGTTVLRNKFGEHDADKLSWLEQSATITRIIELTEDHILPPTEVFDFQRMKEIHRYIFQDVYEWAGQQRVGPVGQFMTKGGPDVVNFEPGDPRAPMVPYNYYPAEGISDALAVQFDALAKDRYLVGLDQQTFIEQLAEYWGEINTIHPFREGNTRSQSVFFSQLAEHAGYIIDIDRFTDDQDLRDEFVNARFYDQATGSSSRLADVLRQAVTPA